MTEKKGMKVSPYYQELIDAHQRIIQELVEDGESGGVTYKQAKDYINDQLNFVPNTRHTRADDLDMFQGLIRRALYQIQKQQDDMKVNDDGENGKETNGK